MTSSHDGFLSEHQSACCRGSFVCANNECPFTKTSKLNQPNKVSWRNVCGVRQSAECIHCPVRKMIEYDYAIQIALVYHIGYHTCSPQISTDTGKLLSQVQKPAKRKGSAKEEISAFIDSGDMFSAEQEADAWMNQRKVKNY